MTNYWLATSADDLTPRAPLEGDRRADVAVVGGGYTGLWTAWYLRERDPALDVVVIEAETVGFGASGRNGAWLSPGVGVTPGELARRASPGIAAATVRAVRDSIDEIAAVCDRAGIDAQLRRGGILRIARGRAEVPALHAGLDELVRLGLGDGVTLLDADALAARVRVADALGALHDPYGAVHHPGRLVRGLARRLEDAGVRIVEGTRVTDLRPGPPAVQVVTDHGVVTADTAVLATEAWLPQLPGRARDVLPIYSLVVLTEPVDDATWARIGWQGHEALSSHRYTVDYLSRTVDGRILFGGRGAPYHFGSAVAPAFDRHDRTHDELARQLTSWFPDLAGVRVEHRWGGPLAMPRDWLPAFRHDPRTGIATANGYTGQGVAATNLAGRVLADLIVTGTTEYAELPMVGHRPRRWEPEPLRWLAARYLQHSLARLDAKAARTGRPPTGRTLAERLVRH
ncbi:NAD(P)/FAD-dependent oxidoreductase [Egicoccus halophilus]|uniref:FAD-dependent oxidoreductase n=1 Tax=Egicoccus halophilus TaxID=1670830 RepID=A0A8J3A6A0_9ACTN|nr:FAD-dependent oxidoreductase [Egicoccus halophilus]GGI04052.1 FAD-dependent oxidoreductase [Egicoccus halophilus]